jgi:hypothetical protein
VVVNNSGQTPEQTSGFIIAEINKRRAAAR